MGVAILGFLPALTGCESYGKSAGLGAALGAGAGALIADDHRVGGALVGAVAGAAAGLVVKDIKETRARKARDAQATAETYSYTPSQGQSMVFENSQVLPSVVRRGNMVEASMQYALLGSPGGTDVTETRSLMRGDREISQVSSQMFTRTDGTWVSTQQFRIPQDLTPGEYTLMQRAYTARSSVSGTTQFYVE